MILLDDLLGGGTDYARMAEGIVGYWLNYVELRPNGSYVWDYAPYGDASRVEDVGHGHIDAGFLWLAYNRSVGDLTTEDMVRLAKTWTQNAYLGNGELAALIDGSGTTKNEWNAGFDWIDLAELDPTVLDIAVEVYDKHYQEPTWSRPFLGWAEILRWTCFGGRFAFDTCFSW